MIFPDKVETIITQRLVLRRLTALDLGAIFSIFSDSEAMRYWGFPPIVDYQGAQQLLAQDQISFQQHTTLRWAIVLQCGNKMIGTCTLFNFEPESSRAEIGYILGQEYWKKGYMHEALVALLDYAFDTLSLNRLEAEIDPRNAASIHTAKRLGFRQEGTFKERWRINGEIADSIMMGLLKKEWQLNKAKS